MKVIFYGDEVLRYPEQMVTKLRLKIMGFLNHPDTEFLYAGNNRFEHLAAIEVKRYENSWQPAKKILVATHPGQVWDDFLYDSRIYPIPWRREESSSVRREKRDQWLIDQADVVCCYIASLDGIAAAFSKKAEQLGKTVIRF